MILATKASTLTVEYIGRANAMKTLLAYTVNHGMRWENVLYGLGNPKKNGRKPITHKETKGKA